MGRYPAFRVANSVVRRLIAKGGDDMDLSTIALFWIGTGTVLTGIGALWFVTVYKEKKE
jgi:hypothetical protein